MNIRWPPLTVRTWAGALYARSPQEDWIDWDHDDVQEALESQRLHELRGLVVGQVAELEGLLLYTASEIRARSSEPLPGRQKRRGAGGALQDLRRLLLGLGLCDKFDEELTLIWRVIQRRNKLVHGRIHVGFSRVGPQAPLEPVIELLLENDPVDDPPSISENEVEEDEDVECGEYELRKYLEEAYLALEAGLDVWGRVDKELPEGGT